MLVLVFLCECRLWSTLCRDDLRWSFYQFRWVWNFNSGVVAYFICVHGVLNESPVSIRRKFHLSSLLVQPWKLFMFMCLPPHLWRPRNLVFVFAGLGMVFTKKGPSLGYSLRSPRAGCLEVNFDQSLRLQLGALRSRRTIPWAAYIYLLHPYFISDRLFTIVEILILGTVGSSFHPSQVW